MKVTLAIGDTTSPEGLGSNGGEAVQITSVIRPGKA
jgi:hypothetical protein